MKPYLLIIALCLGMLTPAIAMAAPVQDLDRIQDLVNQARGLAETARQNSGQATQTTPQPQSTSNPFSATPQSSGIGVQAANGTGVEIGDSNIRINAGGQTFNIPRFGAGSQTLGAGSQTLESFGRRGTIQIPRIGNQVTATGTNVTGMVSAYQNFTAAVEAFRHADFANAKVLMAKVGEADAIQFSEFQSLCFFATGDYKKSAELAYSAASRSQVMDWSQLRSFYGQSESYTSQYEALQRAARQPDRDVSTWFLLGYHHLMLGHREHAAEVFAAVLNKLPEDPVAKHLLSISQQAPPKPME